MSAKLTAAPLPVTDAFLRQKRLVQDRGELALIEDGQRLDHLAWFSLLPGEGRFRGGHSHRVKTEHFYIVSGRGRLLTEDVDSGERAVTPLEAGLKVTVRPGLAHRFEAEEALSVIEYYEGVYDPADDIPFPGLAGWKK